MAFFLGIFLAIVLSFGGSGVVDRNIEKELTKRYGPFEHLHAHADTNFFKLLGGRVDHLDIQAEGFQIEGFPVRKGRLSTGPMQFGLRELLGGKASWQGEIAASASATLDEKSLNAAIAHPEIQSKLTSVATPQGTASIVQLSVKLFEQRFEVQGNLDLGKGFALPFLLSSGLSMKDHQVYPSNIQASAMGFPVPSAMLGNLADKPVPLPMLPDLRYQLDSIRLQPETIEVAASLWLHSPRK